jgi:hypothetical protein
MSEVLLHAKNVITESKSRGYYDNPMPEDNDKIIATANFLGKAAFEAYEKGNRGEDVKAIMKAAETYNISKDKDQDDPDVKRYNSFVTDEISGLPKPAKVDGEEITMPFSLENISDTEILKYIGIYNSCSAYSNYLYSLEEAGEASAKLIADEYFDSFLVKAPKKDPETNKPKTARQIEAEAMIQDDNVQKWRKLQKEHSIRANRYKRLRDIYSDNCERLSRAFTIKQDERNKAYNG